VLLDDLQPFLEFAVKQCRQYAARPLTDGRILAWRCRCARRRRVRLPNGAQPSPADSLPVVRRCRFSHGGHVFAAVSTFSILLFATYSAEKLAVLSAHQVTLNRPIHWRLSAQRAAALPPAIVIAIGMGCGFHIARGKSRCARMMTIV
jgi:hypothetical protein